MGGYGRQKYIREHKGGMNSDIRKRKERETNVEEKEMDRYREQKFSIIQIPKRKGLAILYLQDGVISRTGFKSLMYCMSSPSEGSNSMLLKFN